PDRCVESTDPPTYYSLTLTERVPSKTDTWREADVAVKRRRLSVVIESCPQVEGQTRRRFPRNLSERAQIVLPGMKTRITKSLLPYRGKTQIEGLNRR